ncbi:MAG: hypothetical protein K9L75_06810 [Spirochaetia bacterium]|nr:hypothetical protein [Spirochaetia bacterium]
MENKQVGEIFAEKIGLTLPKRLFCNVSLNKINFIKNTVLKPRQGSGASGVYLLLEDNRYWVVKDKIYYSSFHEVKLHAQELLKKAKVYLNPYKIE